MTANLPAYADTIVVGGGTAGAAVAGLLAEGSDRSVLLLEAGPDYGALANGGWPDDLLDARELAYSHDWGYTSGDQHGARVITLERARVIGGCSAHNGCAAIWGSRLDYDGWAALGNPGWATDALLPLFRAVSERLRVRIPGPEEITPFQRACLAAAPGTGIPRVDDLNDLDEDVGMAPSPANIYQGIRWNASFAYLDPVRGRANFAVGGNMHVDRLVVEHGRVTGALAVGPAGPARVAAGRVVLAAGTYGSPAILLRSGIGDPDELRALGIVPIHPLPGVGRNLHDHPAVVLRFSGTPELERRMTEFAAEHWMPEEQTIAKARSSSCRQGFDLHIYPEGGPYAEGKTAWAFVLPVACLTPVSRGTLKITGPDCTIAPVFRHGYLSDVDGADRRVLGDGVRLARALAAQAPLASLLGTELAPGPGIRTASAITAWIDATVSHYYHPVGTCKMGPASDPLAVVDARGKVHGLTGAYVADASIMPVIPRANTNIPATVVGERIARWLVETKRA